eukprot:TRINITY_DN11124_c0_g1_i2.p1 TRINITY_DN11124_c0_g1~~TRINITY_DN11124_c0_g1_i2.p1  ORF type:complete len:254 (+),score=28.38 TRINITY_DN11124_c0_g1_i2:23-763(+)
MIRRPPRSTHCISSAASDVYKRQVYNPARTVNTETLQEPDSYSKDSLSNELHSKQNASDLVQRKDKIAVNSVQKSINLDTNSRIEKEFSTSKGNHNDYEEKNLSFHGRSASENNSNEKPSTENKLNENFPNIEKIDWEEEGILTNELGTKTFAAPEQMSTTNYDFKVDIYSLGLIFLVLFYPTETLSERYIVLGDCRKHVLPEELVKSQPGISNLIREMTAEDPNSRPTAQQIKNSRVFALNQINI